jgi:hypothetical protein
MTMLTLTRFKTLTEVYGADLQRWPDDERGQAGLLLGGSAEARAMLRNAAAVDHLLDEARCVDPALPLHPGEQVAALARLRSAVGARIAMPLQGHQRGWRARRPAGLRSFALGSWVGETRLAWAGMTLGSGFALLSGFWIGTMHAPVASPSMDLMTMLQSHPVPGLGW